MSEPKSWHEDGRASSTVVPDIVPAREPAAAGSREAAFTRSEVTITVDGDDIAAWFYEPTSPGPHPIIVLGNGFALTRGAGLDRYAERFSQAGIAALAFDYRSFGCSQGRPRQQACPSRQLADWRAVIDYARRHPRLRRDAVAAWGFSFAGGHVISLSAERLGLAAVIALCPFVNGIRVIIKAPPMNGLRLVVAGVRDVLAQRVGRPRVYVPAIAEPGSFGVLSHPGTVSGFDSVHRDGAVFINNVLAAQVLTAVRYRPGRRLAKSCVPVSIHAVRDDPILETAVTRRYARGRFRVSFTAYPGDGHFDLFAGPGFEQAVSDQLRFLGQHLPGVRQ